MVPMGIPIMVLGAVVGVVAASAIFFIRRNQEHNNHRYQYDNNRYEKSERARNVNLTCPFCGRPTVANDYPLACGHLCHVICFRSRPPSIRNNCSFCHDDNQDEVVSRSSSRLHEETRQRTNRTARSSKTGDVLTPGIQTSTSGSVSGSSTSRLQETTQPIGSPTTSSETKNISATEVKTPSPGFESSTKDSKCAYCRIPIENLAANKQLPNCRHYAHEKCMKSFYELLKCRTCNLNGDSSDSADETELPSHVSHDQ
ncbi:uncharacterized protein LOC130667686 [Microplitis mediator]|uniref:uncharacterized protein LOC130667686 n=1 Tax=Microplitis mediator TaxID=375433 RepID=UPI002555DB82|nr:uncharacterized protein LOC130667686 [Microplitis mediator]